MFESDWEKKRGEGVVVQMKALRSTKNRSDILPRENYREFILELLDMAIGDFRWEQVK